MQLMTYNYDYNFELIEQDINQLSENNNFNKRAFKAQFNKEFWNKYKAWREKKSSLRKFQENKEKLEKSVLDIDLDLFKKCYETGGIVKVVENLRISRERACLILRELNLPRYKTPKKKTRSHTLNLINDIFNSYLADFNQNFTKKSLREKYKLTAYFNNVIYIRAKNFKNENKN